MADKALITSGGTPGPVAQAKMLAQSTLVPKHYQGQPANCLIAVDYAQYMRMPVLGVMQNTYVVHGTLGFKSEFLIGRANASGIFDKPIQYESKGEPGDKGFRVRAGAPIGATMYWGPWVTFEMVTQEGWYKNEKYKSMPEVMFRYRAATFFVRQTCPQVLSGAQTVEELEDMAAANPRDVEVEDPAAEMNRQIEAAREAEAAPVHSPEPENLPDEDTEPATIDEGELPF